MLLVRDPKTVDVIRERKISNMDSRIIRLLLRHGAYVNKRNMLGLTLVHVAANSGHLPAPDRRRWIAHST